MAFTDLKREFRHAVSISHPNVVNVLSLEAHQGLYYIVMEFIDGVSLEQKLANGGKLKETDVINVMRVTRREKETLLSWIASENGQQRDLPSPNTNYAAPANRAGRPVVNTKAVRHRNERKGPGAAGLFWGAAPSVYSPPATMETIISSAIPTPPPCRRRMNR